MTGSAKLRILNTSKSLTPEELELLNKNFFDIEQALSSVGAATPGTIPSFIPPSVIDTSNFFLLSGRSGGQKAYGGIDAIDKLNLIGNSSISSTSIILLNDRIGLTSLTPNVNGSWFLELFGGHLADGRTGNHQSTEYKFSHYNNSDVFRGAIHLIVGDYGEFGNELPLITTTGPSAGLFIFPFARKSNYVGSGLNVQVVMPSGNSDATALTLVQSGGQTADIFAYINSSGTKLTRIDKDGKIIAPEFIGIYQAFKVGAIYISVDSTNPNTTLGYGTWSAFGTGRVLIGINGSDTDFDVVEETGGAKTVSSAGTVSAIAATGSAEVDCQTTVISPQPTADQTHTHPAPTFTGSATSVVQPYIVVYMWKRTA
jgi:hypothetical protein